jgi:Fic-DOC domain mobile mystery protein B
MIDDFGDDPIGATPLEENALAGLKPKWVSSRADLNLAEAMNIANAADKYLKRNFALETLLDDLFVRNLHRDMFGEVWSWAGKYRTTDLNIGSSFQFVAVEVAALMQDAKFWFDGSQPEQIARSACELHHRLVQIHPFLNGNGRLCRFFADLVMVAHQQPAFTWRGNDLFDANENRNAYLSALKLADRGNCEPLLNFALGTQDT